MEFGQHIPAYVNQSSTVPLHAKHNSVTCARSELFHPTKPECTKVRLLCIFWWIGTVEDLWIAQMLFMLLTDYLKLKGVDGSK